MLFSYKHEHIGRFSNLHWCTFKRFSSLILLFLSAISLTRSVCHGSYKYHYILLNSQFAVVLNNIICFSVPFGDNSLLVLKVRFHVFSFASKKVQGFSSDRKILMSLLSMLFHLQKRVSVF